MIAEYKGDRSLNGLNVVEATRRKRGSDSLDQQIELILEMQANGGASGVFHGIDEMICGFSGASEHDVRV